MRSACYTSNWDLGGRYLKRTAKKPKVLSGPNFFEKVTCRIRQTNETWHEGARVSVESDPWCLWTPRLSGISHLISCHGHSRCMFHAACTARSCTAHARDSNARAMRLSWSSDQDNPHEHPVDYHIIRNLDILTGLIGAMSALI